MRQWSTGHRLERQLERLERTPTPSSRTSSSSAAPLADVLMLHSLARESLPPETTTERPALNHSTQVLTLQSLASESLLAPHEGSRDHDADQDAAGSAATATLTAALAAALCASA